MTWKPDIEGQPKRSEVSKCRLRLIPYCLGVGLDIGCGNDKILNKTIGVDRDGKADINLDVSNGLFIFADEVFDYIFSAHCLEDFQFPEIVLKDWWSKVKVGGYLILYLPHKDLYPNIGQVGCNVDHKHDFVPQDIVNMMDNFFASYVIVHQRVNNEDDEYSFETVFKKLANFKLPNKYMAYSSRAINFNWNEVAVSQGI